MRALLLCAAVAAVVGLGFFACNPNSIGRPCVNPSGDVVLGTQVSSPALECPSRLCLLQKNSVMVDGGAGNIPRATCTAFCDTDDDCVAETKDYCAHGFKCAVATEAGDFCCRKMCVCQDDLQVGVNLDQPDGAVIQPTSCDPMQYSGTMCPACPYVAKQLPGPDRAACGQ
jgi:hypothetical protein